ncbi:MAG: sigma-70 family RNA polymerase sigma factor [Terriglobia bacterium]
MRLRPHHFHPEGALRKVCTRENRAQHASAIHEDRSEAERNRKVVELLPLLHKIARKMRAHLPANIEVDDLVGAGSLGLVDAVLKFDARKKVKIESYAQHRIRGAILDSLRSMDGASRDLRKKNKKAEQVHRQVEAKLGHPATDQDMASAQHVSLKSWYRTVREIQPLGVEWLRPMGTVGVKRLTEETMVSEGQKDQFDLCYRREKREILGRALATLTEREQMILSLYYARENTMKQIGAKLRIDESRVSQLHSAALGHLRAAAEPMLIARQPGIMATHLPQELAAA